MMEVYGKTITGLGPSAVYTAIWLDTTDKQTVTQGKTEVSVNKTQVDDGTNGFVALDSRW